VAQHVELVARDRQRLLLEREGQPVDDDESDEVPRRPDRQVAELERLGRPGAERQLPGQIEQPRATIAQPELREARDGDGGRFRQSFLRR
jgi:hypothetical protein